MPKDLDNADTKEPLAREQALRRLLAQLQGGVSLVEEILDEDYPGWDAPASRGRHKIAGRDTAPRYLYGQLCIAWVNAASQLMEEPGVETWSVPPLISRSLQEPGKVTFWEFTPAHGIEISTADQSKIKLENAPANSVRVVAVPEARYTLDQARRILQGCTEHRWVADLDKDGQLHGVRCSTLLCRATRPLADA